MATAFLVRRYCMESSLLEKNESRSRGPAGQGAGSVEGDLRGQAGEGDVVILRSTGAQLRAAQGLGDGLVEAGVEVEMDLLPVAADPLGLPPFWGKCLAMCFLTPRRYQV